MAGCTLHGGRTGHLRAGPQRVPRQPAAGVVSVTAVHPLLVQRAHAHDLEEWRTVLRAARAAGTPRRGATLPLRRRHRLSGWIFPTLQHCRAERLLLRLDPGHTLSRPAQWRLRDANDGSGCPGLVACMERI